MLFSVCAWVAVLIDHLELRAVVVSVVGFIVNFFSGEKTGVLDKTQGV